MLASMEEAKKMKHCLTADSHEVEWFDSMANTVLTEVSYIRKHPGSVG